ncbi:leucine-rich repeat domain-containing protein [uncultured Porphyromonas sp.]|uniref:InlB B-repeat-containing protein n=1 Tax=uncultured Porphyromonas sp. TaxID=159274 RepID=UPI0026205EB4|nr:leucine-rich repeat domain-containing protein [uncultured Porphyromonas sp.]
MSKQLRIWLFVLLGTLLASTTLLARGVITMTFYEKSSISLKIEAKGDVSIEGVREYARTDGQLHWYTLTSETVTIRGDVTYLDCYKNNLKSLDVSGCTSLTALECYENQLTSLDVSKNTALTKLECQKNQLYRLDVSKNTALTELSCYNNHLTSLDVSGCTSLTALECYENQLTSLDVSKNTALTELYCGVNQLTSLDVSKNTALTKLGCSCNQLTSLDVSKNTALTTLDCLKNKLTSLDVSGHTALTTLDCFYNQLTSLEASGCTALANLDCYGNPLTSINLSGCQSLKGFSLKEFSWSVGKLTSLNVSGCTSLTTLDCSNNRLTSLNVSGCTALTTLKCSDNPLTSINLSGCQSLKEFSWTGGKLTSLDASGCTALTELYCYDNRLTSLDVSGCTSLTTLECNNNQLTSLEASGCTALTELNCRNNPLTSINLSGCQSLKEFSWTWGKLTRLEVSGCTAMTSLDCTGNKLTSLDLSKNVALTTLNCSYNQLSNLDLSDNRALKTLDCVKNQLTSLDLSNHSALESLSCGENQLIQLNLSGCSGLKELSCYTNKLIRLDISGCRGLTKLWCIGNQLTSLNASGCKSLTELNCNSNPLRRLDVSGCTALTKLDCHKNQLTNLDVSSCTALKWLYCQENQLTNLNAQGCTALIKLQCQSNQLTSLNVSGMSNLTTLSCWKNQLSSLDVTSCTALTKLECYDNRLASLDVSKNNRLTTLDCQQNQLASLNLSGCRALTTLKCNKNQLTSLNLSDGVALQEFDCSSNKLTSLDFYTCRALTKLDCSDNALSGIDLLQCRELSWLRCSINQIKTSAMTALINSLPDRQGKTAGMLQVVDKESTKEGNLCFADHVTKATAKNWQAQSYQSNTWSDYAGSEVPTFAVTSSATTGGMVAIIGAPDLTKVPYGTELTVITEFADGYKLTALTANGKDILATKKFLVTEATEVKATFMPLTCSVSLIFNQEEGTITVPGVSNLDEVVPDTELTIEVTPAAGYELTSLTANGRDILATKKVVVTENMTIKATFAKKHLKVSTEKVGEGLFEVTGADDLNSVLYGTELTVSVTPATGYELTSLMANDTDISATKKVIVKENLTIKATFTKKVFAVTLSKEGEGTLATTGAEDLKAVPYGTEVTIVATPAMGYELKSIEANGTDITATKKVVVREAVAVKATFVKKTFAVELTKEGEGTITADVEDLNAVPYGTKLTITATPAEGYELVALVANNVDISDTKSIEVTESMTIKATFAKKSFAVTFDKVGEGTVTATGADDLNAVAYGTELTIVATPAAGYELQSLVAGGVDITATKKIVVKDNLTVTAAFAKKSFAVSLTKEGEGTITATGATSLNAVAYGTELTIVATPAEGYELTALTANGTDILASKKVIVKEAVEVKAIFAKKSFAVTFAKEGEGTISATGATSLDAVVYGTELTINATPAEGYELTALTANGTDILASKKVIVKEAVEVKATFSKKSFAVSLTKEGEGAITATGATSLNAVAYGTELTIVATPATGYELVSITAGGTDITASKKVVVTGNLTVKATFAKKNFAVSLTKEGEGTITATGASNLNSVAYGTELTIVATPAEGYELVSITSNGTDITASKKVVVTGNLTVKASFAKKNFSVSLTKEGEGTITATGATSLNAVAYGTELTINATPAEGYELTALTANGTDILATKKIVVKDNLTIKATFAKKNFAVSLTKEGEGTITATGASNLNSVAYGTELTIVATPAEGYELVSITAGGTDITASKKVVVTDNLTVKATFTKKSFAVSLTKEGEGTITATGASNLNSVAYGTELTIVATPAKGYELTALTANGTDILATKKVVVEGNLTVKATFAKKNFAVSLTKEGEGTITATGADGLNAVAYGTELTINATPAMGYELQSLVAGGVDITATKKIVVKDNLTVKATFTKKSFAVTFAKEGDGTVTAAGATSLDAVAYGTELTIVATPAEGYELTALTANGTDILATKKVVVEGNLTVKATFTKKSFAVSLTKEGEGMISATGASNLNSVAYGTELTIVATPAEGYELTALTANGTDILATKKIVVKDNLTVKATFTKKSFAVSLTKEGEGTITATGATSLNAVAYGTELTIVATPAKGYELTALTANGTDILATKKIVVKENLTVKAIFTKKSFAVSLTKEGEGTITATGASSLNAVAYGTELTINATPAMGYELQSLVAGGVDITATKKIVVKGNLTVKATFSKKSFAVSLTKEGEGTITATGASNLNSVAYGTELTIVATPAEGYELVSITAGGTDITASKKVVVTGNLTVKATFAKKNFAVSLTKEGEGRISATGASNLNSVAYGTELTINATPAEGYELVSITANGTDITATKKVVVTDNMAVKATFTKKSFAVSLTKEGEGTISATGATSLNTVAYGTELTINATPAKGYELTALTANGTDILATKKIVVTDNMTVKATFAKKNFAVSLTKEGEGAISATGASSLNAVAYGTELTINATPAKGYELVSITANGTDITATKKIVVTDNLTIKATFTKKNFAVSLTKEGEGTITATGASNLNSVAYGTELTINATPAMGYELQSLVAGGVDITATKKIVVKDNMTVKATFAKKSFAVSLTKEGEGTITATGASNLNSVAYGTELTINATPAEGYELTALTANGTDILATKKIVVEGNLTVKATFTKKSFAVSLTKEGEGMISATGASNLNSVAYDTELTIVATPAKGYELVSITAGGADITATKKVVVKDNLTVKATFAKKVFAVSLTKEGEGTITATGASDLNSVAYGTELTIVATPAEGYELTALTANGTDILATKKVVVEGNLTVKATFEKKTFAVTLTSNDHGDITIAEPVDLKAVPYGTTLTVKATGKNAQCVLTELTANGEDILATQSFVVTDVTEVKATFVDHTGVERTVKQQTQLYPNPATDYVIVEGVAPASEVTLHSMTGERLYAGRADSRGTLQIDLTPYADGVYLVCVAGDTYRVVVRH